MNIMNMPGFTAETSLYKTSGHYQTSRQVINLPTQMIRVITPAAIKGDGGIDCDNCVGGQCVELHCLEKWIHGKGFWGGGGGDGPVEPCLNHDVCSACFPLEDNILSHRGRKFCQHFICQPTFSGGCRCQVFKGYESCDPFRDPVIHI